MNYEEALEYIETNLKGGCNPGLERIISLLDLLGNPHKNLKAIHIAGTNGKGSVVAMISSILREASYKVGTYISPHLIDYRERYLINGTRIDEASFVKYTKILKSKIDYMRQNNQEIPSQFEMLTALAFLYMDEEQVDIAVIEVGLGGRYDATNVVNALISVITSISYDHMGILGNSIEEIAYEKAGIIKKDGCTILYPQKYIGADRVVKSICEELNSNLINVDSKKVIQKDFNQDGQVFDYTYNNYRYADLKIPFLGDHQLLNAALAITTAASLNDFGFNLVYDDILRGLKIAAWPGRLSIISKDPLILIDGAHNEEGIVALSKAFDKYFKGKRLIVIMGMLKDKEYEKNVSIIAPKTDVFIATEIAGDRILTAEELASIAKKYSSNVYIEASLKNAIELSKSMYNNDSIICICGSLYLAGEAYKIFGHS